MTVKLATTLTIYCAACWLLVDFSEVKCSPTMFKKCDLFLFWPKTQMSMSCMSEMQWLFHRAHFFCLALCQLNSFGWKRKVTTACNVGAVLICKFWSWADSIWMQQQHCLPQLACQLFQIKWNQHGAENMILKSKMDFDWMQTDEKVWNTRFEHGDCHVTCNNSSEWCWSRHSNDNALMSRMWAKKSVSVTLPSWLLTNQFWIEQSLQVMGAVGDVFHDC